MTDLLTDRAAAFIGRRRTAPFLLSLHYTAPHSPWEGPGDVAMNHATHGGGPMVAGGSLAIYAEMVKSMDAGIGRVLQALARAGLERNTLVVFTSDNGGERYSFNWPFSFQKSYLWEGGVRVPAIVRWRSDRVCASSAQRSDVNSRGARASDRPAPRARTGPAPPAPQSTAR